MPMPAKAGCDCGRFSIWPIRAIGPSSSRWRRACTRSSSRRAGRSRARGLRAGAHPVSQEQYGELVQVFREIKDAFDPQNQLNPGKVIGDDPHLMLRNLKPWPEVPAEAMTDPSSVLSWHGTSLREPQGGSGEIRALDRAAGDRRLSCRAGNRGARARRAARGARDRARPALAWLDAG